ncbi:MAG: phosphotransferase family protein [Gammaproteobacteria bacterium]|nr:phosphotransferase family protein [Gammaproteobacteria bacterium]MBT3866939.1 phosphotransferase family protein [Gammaproteobacteria bacterium]MBT4380746.1 phosphotransferase family protein [Gammaproteobacteria bacterium]MBT4617731.1 phosphotransferase family protein [Gammaproteobacteria bacterium]MBT5198232.1 phosphotransferase family protein [Gammaproteobacteria bacterium]
MVEGINVEKVTRWLVERIPGIKPPLSFSLIAGGHSNLTFRCEDGAGKVYVLRRPPLGHVLESAHDMGREHKIIDALKGSDVPVPTNHGLCKDNSVNEADFYVMEFVDGLVLNDSVIAATLPEASRIPIGEDVVDILCKLHAINPDDVGLGDLGRKEAYLARQLKRWTKQWEAAKTHDIPEMEESCRLLADRMPEQIGATIVHGDFRLGNMIVADGKVKAILDWELCTLGDPLADVAYLMNNWVTLEEVPEPGEGDQSPSAAGGFITREKIAEIYEKATDRDLSGINYYRAFSHWRLAAIGQGVYKRYLVGAMGEDTDVDLEKQKAGVARRATSALELLS